MKKTQDLITLKDNFRMKSVERGNKALNKDRSKNVMIYKIANYISPQYLEEFNKEMDKLQKVQNEEKIKEGIRNPNA